MKVKAFVSITVAVVMGTAAPTVAGVGDVISSFKMDGARNIYRDANYVYCVVGANTLRRYTVGGSLVGTVALAGLTRPGDADHSPLGPGYLAVIEGSNWIFEYRIANGSLVRSTSAGPSTLGYAYFPGGAYFYTHTGASVYRYTTSGSLVNKFDVPYSATEIAATNRFNDKAGEYVIVATRSMGRTYVYTGAGGIVTTFTIVAAPSGCVCGPGTPYTPKTTYWCNVPMGASRFAYQFDLANKNVAVAPASLGKIRALYR
ncbi:MAG: hypothetical protein GTN49_07505 [candidate division Zixibacteria bacterium]|nr:hypothetical protein [candidate division Zixibacteria bacterium]